MKRPLILLMCFLVFSCGPVEGPQSQTISKENYGTIKGRILYDGTPIAELTNAKPNMTFRVRDIRNRGKGTPRHDDFDWRIEGSNYVVTQIPQGSYSMLVFVDANEDNAPGLPGDFTTDTIYFEINKTGSTKTIDINLRQRMRLLKPVDSYQKQPYALPPALPEHLSPVEFKWEALPGADYYDYVVLHGAPSDKKDGTYVMVGTAAGGRTRETSCRLELPPSKGGQFYEFSVYASHRSGVIGYFLDYSFGVSEKENQGRF